MSHGKHREGRKTVRWEDQTEPDIESTRSWKKERDEDVQNRIEERTRLRPLTVGQEVYMKAIETSVVTLCTGPAGTGKTYMACGIAAQMLREGRIDRIILTRPLVSCGQGYGFRPGSVMEKVLPVMRPMLEALEDFFTKKELQQHLEEETIALWPLDDMRGSSIKQAVVICDEAQNAEYAQLRMLLTRFGTGTRVVVNGDATQTDLRVVGMNPFERTIDRLWNLDTNISIVQLTRADIVRHPLIQKIDEALARP